MFPQEALFFGLIPGIDPIQLRGVGVRIEDHFAVDLVLSHHLQDIWGMGQGTDSADVLTRVDVPAGDRVQCSLQVRWLASAGTHDSNLIVMDRYGIQLQEMLPAR